MPLSCVHFSNSFVFDLEGVFLLCIFLPQSAIYLAGTQCTLHDPLPAQGVHQGDE